MTPADPRRPTVRLTAALVRDGGPARPVVVTVHPEFLELRLKGRRRSETLDLVAAYHGAVRARVMKERAERKAKRKGK